MRRVPSAVNVLTASSEGTASVWRTSLTVGRASTLDSSLYLAHSYIHSISLSLSPSGGPEKGLFDDMTDDEVLVLQQMFFGVVICALATLAAKGDMVFTAIFIGGVAAMAGYWLSEKGDRMLDGFLKGR